MTFYAKPKYASRNARMGPWVTCDQCGFIWSQSSMQFQYDFEGGSVPQNTNFLVCPKCVTPYTYQRKLLVIPPDPPPKFNLRPANNEVDSGGSPTIEIGATININFGLTCAISIIPDVGLLGMWDFTDPLQSSEILTCGIA